MAKGEVLFGVCSVESSLLLPQHCLEIVLDTNAMFFYNLPVTEASKEVANLTERKNPHTPVYGVKEFVCLSVCLSVCLLQTLTTIISGLAEQNWLKNIDLSS